MVESRIGAQAFCRFGFAVPMNPPQAGFDEELMEREIGVLSDGSPRRPWVSKPQGPSEE